MYELRQCWRYHPDHLPATEIVRLAVARSRSARDIQATFHGAAETLGSIQSPQLTSAPIQLASCAAMRLNADH